MPTKGLGAGLGALLGGAALEDNTGAAEYLPLTRIEPRPGQPRSNFDEESLQELSDSIREHGIIQPIIRLSPGNAAGAPPVSPGSGKPPSGSWKLTRGPLPSSRWWKICSGRI